MAAAAVGLGMVGPDSERVGTRERSPSSSAVVGHVDEVTRPRRSPAGSTGAVDLRLQVLGLSAAVGCPSTAARDALAGQWSRAVQPAPQGSAEIATDLGPDDPEAPGFGYDLSSTLTRLAIRALMGRFFLFHAAGLARSDGEVVALVAASGTGKSTAARTLGRHLGYVTDETLAVDPDDGSVVPYPKPLSLEAGRAGVKDQVSPDDLGLLECPESALRLGHVVLLDRQSSHAGPPRLAPVALLDAVLALVPQLSAVDAVPRPLERLCALIEGLGGVHRLTYSEIDSATGLLAEPGEQWGRHVPASWEPVGPVGPVDPGEVRPGEVTLAPSREAVAVEGEVLVLVARVPVRLRGVGALVHRLLAEEGGFTMPALTRRVQAQLGNGSTALVEPTVAAMAAAGVVLAAERSGLSPRWSG